MGFFANMKSASTWKKGKKHADNGDFGKALVYFDDAARAATDEKTLYEHRSWYYLTKAINHSKLGELEEAKVSFAKFVDETNNFKSECGKTPGIGSTTRFNTTYDALKQFSGQYHQYLSKIEK